MINRYTLKIKTQTMELTLIRTYYPGGTNGSLHVYGILTALCYTIELPWHDNKPGLSCIPEGRYAVKMRFSKKFLTHMIIEGVKDRALILIHPANNAVKELKGCIAPVRKLTGEGRGSESRRAFDKLKRIVIATLEKEPVYLTIKSIQYDNKGKSTGTNTAIL